MMKQPQPITLSSDKIKLVPLAPQHLNGFYQAGQAPQLWRWVQPHQCRDLSTAAAWLDVALQKVEQGLHVAFVIVDIASDQIVGSTRYCSIDLENSGLEIGFSFIAPQYQRSYVNSHAKLLLLQHAFEQLGAIRVQFRTHHQNQQSRNAISRLGATFEGVIRHQRILANGDIRDTAQFSITDLDWPEVKRRLRDKCDNHSTPAVVKQLPEFYQQLIKRNPLAQVMIAGADNLSEQIIYLPLVYNQASGKLIGHLSASNKLNGLLERNPELVVIFRGDDSYISPSIHPELVVPTWNYQVVHLQASLQFVADEQPPLKQQLLAQQVEYFDTTNWQLTQQPQSTIERMLEHIRCFELTIIASCHRYKMSQNKAPQIVSAIASHLEQQAKLEFARDHLADIDLS